MPNKPTTWKACQEALDEAHTEIAKLTARNVSQREQLEVLEQLQDGEIAEHVRLAEEAKDAEIARLKSAAAGHGMVSEMADMSEVAVLVVGLHERIARVEQERDALHADLDLQIKRTEETRNERDALREKLNAIRNSPVDTPVDA